MKNPIENNRLVQDVTFALRFLDFVLSTDCGDACGEDEKTSMVSYAVNLLKYQIETVDDEEEMNYLNRCTAQKKLDNGLKFLN